MLPNLTTNHLQEEAGHFAAKESKHSEKLLFGVTDGKAVGTYFEQKFRSYLSQRYKFEEGNAAKGIDFPGLNVDMKSTSVKQPQSSCPFRSAQQKIYGLGYSLLVFVYEKTDCVQTKTSQLDIQHCVFIEQRRTADYQTTRGILEILDRDGNTDDLVAFIGERNLPVDEIGSEKLAKLLLENPPELGYLTISNALQWRLQYKRVIEEAGSIDGIIQLGK